MSGATSIFGCNFQMVRYFITFNFPYRIYNKQSDLVLIIAVVSLQLSVIRASIHFPTGQIILMIRQTQIELAGSGLEVLIDESQFHHKPMVYGTIS